jgi:uncharacterized repeat protein (TIGR04138 family)
MQEVNFDEALERMLASDTRYHRSAYLFLREALDHTHKMLGKADTEAIHHVTGGQLLDGIREYAAQQFGPMAMTVLAEWGIHKCEDWGEIVFAMIEHNLLAKTEQDSRDDFKGGYDFFEAFRRPFLPAKSLPVERLSEAHSQA